MPTTPCPNAGGKFASRTSNQYSLIAAACTALTSFDANTDYTVTDSAGAAQTMTVAVSTSGSANCGPSSTSCTITVRANLAPGTYTFTLKKDAQLLDALGNMYVQPADKVIHFTVKDAEATPAVQCL